MRRGHGTHSRRAIRPLNSTLGASSNSAPTAERGEGEGVREGGWEEEEPDGAGGWGRQALGLEVFRGEG